ncbi:SDR family NAD(P)-dependent oxidoreductase, partial [Nonomuraea angiospora]|uniref:SDR family NAD(P)-dependent oxidoreductase n=1 Tax=Nonomuraea angiospora TaxID=46172 RepID=UPI0029BA2BF7
RKNHPEPDTLLTAIATTHTHNTTTTPNWHQLLPNATTTDLPTYPFQHHHYWLEAPSTVTNVDGLGQAPADHPLLGAAVELPDQGGVVLTGRISVAAHPWLADHAVGEKVVFPGTGFVELVVRGADEVGCSTVEELTIETPLVIERDESILIQVAVAAAGEDGRREATVYARSGTRPWTRHAAGIVAAADSGDATGFDWSQWPPAGAQAVDVSSHYETLSAAGYGYGPAFQGLKRAWERDGEVFAEVELGEREAAEAGRYGIHPALLDAALHAIGVAERLSDDSKITLPFAWTDVRLHASAASHLRVRLRRADDGAVTLETGDSAGQAVASIGSLILRELADQKLTATASASSLLRMDWVPPTGDLAGAPVGDVAVVGERWAGLAAAVESTGGGVEEYADVAAVGDAVASGQALPAAVVMRLQPATAGQDGLPEALRSELDRVVGVLRDWLADERLAETRLVLVTSGAVTTGTEAGSATDGALVEAAVSGLVRSAQAESPGRILLVDVDDAADSLTALPSVLGVQDEPQLAVRAGRVLVPRLARADASGDLPAPDGPDGWRLDSPAKGSIDALNLIPAPEADRELTTGEVRVDVRAAGLNFRDVLNSLGMYPGEAGAMGVEFAGVIAEVGPGVNGVGVGDRVMGMGEGTFGPRVVADHRMMARMPQGWNFARAASVPGAFATAWYGLVDLAGLSRGERVLIHSGAGGVGMAAIQIARHLGAEVFATASPAKQHLLRAMGVADDHIASSRDLDFADAFAAVTGGEGVDVVLNSLAGPFTDASLDLLAPGGRFIEMGKTDLRDPADVENNGIRYRSFDLMDAGHERIGQMLGELLDLFAGQKLAGLPVRCWPVQQARQAFRHMAQARHTGKIVLTMPRALDPDGTVLITGGTGGLGAILARHLTTEHQARHLLLASRRGDQAPEADRLRADLEAAGATVDITACDLSDPEQVTALLDRVHAEHPLTAVFHAAGVVDDGVIDSLTPDRIDRVLRPKADAAWHLHQATRHLDLAAFVLYSSSAGTLDSAGQGNYSAANAFLDALAIHRHTTGLPAQSLAWGVWAPETGGMTRRLGDIDLERLSRSGFTAMGAAEGMHLLDAALTMAEPFLVPLPMDARALGAREDGIPAVLRGLARTPARRTAQSAAPAADGESALQQRLAGLPPAEQERMLVSLVRTEAAGVLGHASEEHVDPDRSFSELGFDSLTSVELRNRLGKATGLRLPATLIFDYPNAVAIAEYMGSQLLPQKEPVESQALRSLDELGRLLGKITIDVEARSEITLRLQKLVDEWRGDRSGTDEESKVRTASADELFSLIDQGL